MGDRTCIETLWYYSKKKTLNHPKADEEKRQQFLLELSSYEEENRPIVYLDESGFKYDDYRVYGYSDKGQKCFGKYNWQAKNLTNAIGAIYNNELFAVALFESSINSDVFYYWVENLLIPELPKNSVIVMDNATFHKRSDIQELLERDGYTILWLPPYSPDLNPIEQIWAWLKNLRKNWRLKSVGDLFFYFLWICTIFNID